MSDPQIIIERLAFGGSGVGRIDGKVCFVPFSAPGDRLRVRITRQHHSWMEADIDEVIEASSLRTEPVCPLFGQCGGCDWQHLEYGAQCDAKRSILLETIQRVGKLADPSVAETLAAASPYGYRARAQFKLFMARDGLKAGFYRRGSRFVIDLPSGCPVVTESVNAALIRLRRSLETVSDPDRIPQISIEEGESGCYAIVHYIGSNPAQLGRHLARHEDRLELAGLFLQQGRKDTLAPVFGDDRITYQVPVIGKAGQQISLGYGIGGFSQVNRQQNRTMVEQVGNSLSSFVKPRLLDLYCGNGNLSLPMAGSVQELLGIEEYAPSIASAVDNSRQTHVNNSTFSCADAAAEVRRLVEDGKRFELVLLDPPRSGALEVSKALPLLKPDRIVYVSCDPGTLARDLSILTAKKHYRLDTAIPLDMFPQTGHIETIACLSIN